MRLEWETAAGADESRHYIRVRAEESAKRPANGRVSESLENVGKEAGSMMGGGAWGQEAFRNFTADLLYCRFLLLNLLG